jgi:hypothetical protein
MKSGADLIETLLGKPCKVAGNLLADQIYVWQWTNRARAFARAREIIEKEKIPARVLPAGFLMPVLDEVGNVDSPELQELWARLIVSGLKDARHQHPAFAETLRRMSGEDARFIETYVITAAGGAGAVQARFSNNAPADCEDIVERLDALNLLSAGPVDAQAGTVNFGMTGFGVQVIRATH